MHTIHSEQTAKQVKSQPIQSPESSSDSAVAPVKHPPSSKDNSTSEGTDGAECKTSVLAPVASQKTEPEAKGGIPLVPAKQPTQAQPSPGPASGTPSQDQQNQSRMQNQIANLWGVIIAAGFISLVLLSFLQAKLTKLNRDVDTLQHIKLNNLDLVPLDRRITVLENTINPTNTADAHTIDLPAAKGGLVVNKHRARSN
jgi:hypothetical protein